MGGLGGLVKVFLPEIWRIDTKNGHLLSRSVHLFQGPLFLGIHVCFPGCKNKTYGWFKLNWATYSDQTPPTIVTSLQIVVVKSKRIFPFRFRNYSILPNWWKALVSLNARPAFWRSLIFWGGCRFGGVGWFAIKSLGWFFQRFFMFTHILGKMSSILTNIFRLDWTHQLEDMEIGRWFNGNWYILSLLNWSYISISHVCMNNLFFSGICVGKDAKHDHTI